ncbi:MAG: ATP-binding protein [Muribaculaceae bacterium]|nr:ATP-binding protein [Muribaculaceae bacterium]
MDILRIQQDNLIHSTSLDYVRDFYNEIEWEDRLIGIKGARGVGKTTLMIQRIKLAYPNSDKVRYISLDNIWFSTHSLIDYVYSVYNEGVTHIFIDEIHHLERWEQYLKNIYDSFPELHIVFTGSSLLEIDYSIADLSRRLLMYDMPGLSFREYLEFKGFNYPKLSLKDILYDNIKLTNLINPEQNMVRKFHSYLKHGYFPFFLKGRETEYLCRVANMVSTVIERDIPSMENMDYISLMKAKQLLGILSEQTPSNINIEKTARNMEVSKNLLLKLLFLLERSQILRLLYYKNERSPKSLAKPQKILFDNASIAYSLGVADVGRVRESFLASAFRGHLIGYPLKGDLLVDNRYLFEVGGTGKGFSQIANLPDSFIAADDIEFAFGNKIPLWMFGFLY